MSESIGCSFPKRAHKIISDDELLSDDDAYEDDERPYRYINADSFHKIVISLTLQGESVNRNVTPTRIFVCRGKTKTEKICVPGSMRRKKGILRSS